VNGDPVSRGRLLDRLLAACCGSLLAYLLTSHTVRGFLAGARRLVEKVLETLGGA
jgi:hypothetical protein